MDYKSNLILNYFSTFYDLMRVCLEMYKLAKTGLGFVVVTVTVGDDGNARVMLFTDRHSGRT